MFIVTGIYNLKDLEDPHLQEDPLLIKCAEGLGKELPKDISKYHVHEILESRCYK